MLGKTLESPLDSKEIKPVNHKGNLPWIFIVRTEAEAEVPTVHLMQRVGSSEKTLMLEKIEGKWRRGQKGWGGCMASPTQWTWVWANSGRWWRTGKPDVLQSMGSQRVRHNWASEQNDTDRRQGLKHLLLCECTQWRLSAQRENQARAPQRPTPHQRVKFQESRGSCRIRLDPVQLHVQIWHLWSGIILPHSNQATFADQTLVGRGEPEKQLLRRSQWSWRTAVSSGFGDGVLVTGSPTLKSQSVWLRTVHLAPLQGGRRGSSAIL